MTQSEMDRRLLAEKKIMCQSLACRAARYFYQGDLPTARNFFAVLVEVRQEMRELERGVMAQQHRRASLLSPRKPWFERS